MNNNFAKLVKDKRAFENLLTNKLSAYSKNTSREFKITTDKNQQYTSTQSNSNINFSFLREFDFSNKNFFKLMDLPTEFFLRACYKNLLKRKITLIEENAIINSIGTNFPKKNFILGILNSEEFKQKAKQNYKRRVFAYKVKLKIYSVCKKRHLKLILSPVLWLLKGAEFRDKNFLNILSKLS